jgi:hypothetical protein
MAIETDTRGDFYNTHWEEGGRTPIYRMPYGYGPSLGPRQGPNGLSFNGDWSRVTTVGVAFRTDADAVAALLPPGFVPADDPIVRFQCHFNTDFGWLAGRGYHFAEVLFAARFEGEQDQIEGDFVSVMWESKPDPAIPGREEIGLPKIFGTIPDLEDVQKGDGNTYMEISWEGFKFLELELTGLELKPWPSAAEEGAESTKVGLGSSKGRHRMYYKYIPRTGEWGAADAEYVTYSPPSNYEAKPLESWSGTGSVRFNPSTWEDLPTMAHIVNRLAALPCHEVTDAMMARALIAFNDLRADQRIAR